MNMIAFSLFILWGSPFGYLITTTECRLYNWDLVLVTYEDAVHFAHLRAFLYCVCFWGWGVVIYSRGDFFGFLYDCIVFKDQWEKSP